MAEEEKVRVFVGEHCQPCHQLKKLLEEGKFVINKGTDLEMVDVESEEGFQLMVQLGLITGLPSAFRGQKQCVIDVDEEEGVVFLDCPD